MSDVPQLWRRQLERDGVVLLPGAMPEHKVDWLFRSHRTVMLRKSGGDKKLQSAHEHVMRDLLRYVMLLHVVCSERPLGNILVDLMGEECGVVQALWLNKRATGRSWLVPWHRDLVFPVKAHLRTDRAFRHPTVKSGMPFVRFPKEVLDQLLLVRVHIDAVGDEDGPLEVIAGSHLDDTQHQDGRAVRRVLAARGDVLLLRPRVLHRSGRQTAPAGDRRVVQFVVAPHARLPERYQYHDFKRFAQCVNREQMMAEVAASVEEQMSPRGLKINELSQRMMDVAEALLAGKVAPITADDARSVRALLRELERTYESTRLDAMEQATRRLGERMDELTRQR